MGESHLLDPVVERCGEESRTCPGQPVDHVRARALGAGGGEARHGAVGAALFAADTRDLKVKQPSASEPSCGLRNCTACRSLRQCTSCRCRSVGRLCRLQELCSFASWQTCDIGLFRRKTHHIDRSLEVDIVGTGRRHGGDVLRLGGGLGRRLSGCCRGAGATLERWREGPVLRRRQNGAEVSALGHARQVLLPSAVRLHMRA